jgi:organic radical activating enzyme
MKKFKKILSGFSYKYFLKNGKNNSLLGRAEKKESDFPLANVKFPKNAMVELTAGCNHACVFCTNPRMEIKGSRLNIELYKNFVNDGKKLGLKEIGFYMRGEPLLDKRLSTFIEIAKNAGIEYIYITTNGALANIKRMKNLIDAGLTSVKFSINSASREKYLETHGKDDFDKVVKNLRDLNEYRKKHKKKIKIISSFVVTKFTECEIEEYKKVFLHLVDDMKILGVHGQAGQSLKELQMLESDELTAPFPKIGAAKPCTMLWDRVHLTQDGFLSLCCVDYDNNLIYADLNKVSLESAWNNDIINKMRKLHATQKLKGTLCHNCLYGTNDSYEPLKIETQLNYDKRSKTSFTKSKKNVIDRIVKLSNL